MLSKQMIFGLCAFGAAISLLLICYYTWRRRFIRAFEATGIPRAASTTSLATIEELERSIGGKLPDLLRDAYLSGSIARIPMPAKLSSVHGMESSINQFIAANAAANHGLLQWTCKESSAFIFAGDDGGNYYFVRGGCDAVFFWDHESGVSENFKSFQDFLNALGQPTPASP